MYDFHILAWENHIQGYVQMKRRKINVQYCIALFQRLKSWRLVAEETGFKYHSITTAVWRHDKKGYQNATRHYQEGISAENYRIE